MSNTDTQYVLLFAAAVCGVVQATLARAGIGRVENLPNGPTLLVLGAVSIPLGFLSNLGLIGVSIWSLFALELIPAAGVLVAGFAVWGLIWGAIFVALRRSAAWMSVASIGIPLVLLLRLVTSGCVVLLAWTFLFGNRL